MENQTENIEPCGFCGGEPYQVGVETCHCKPTCPNGLANFPRHSWNTAQRLTVILLERREREAFDAGALRAYRHGAGEDLEDFATWKIRSQK